MEYTQGQQVYVNETKGKPYYHCFEIGQQVEVIGHHSKEFGSTENDNNIWVIGTSKNTGYPVQQELPIEDLSDTPPK